MLPERIEFGRLRELAERRAQGELRIATSRMPRLQALLASGPPTEIAVEAGLSAGEDGRARLELRITGELLLTCQRCLGRMEWPLRTRARLTVLADEAEAAELPDPFDAVLLEGNALDLVQVVEDEILSTVPLAPMHRAGAECLVGAAVIAQPEGVSEPMTRPFAGLAALMGRGDDDDATD